MGKFFGTDGVRGVANRDLTPELAFSLGRAAAMTFARQFTHRAKIVVGKDTRISGDLLESALSAGLMSTGADVIRAGIIPTPGIAYLTRFYGADAGVMISASHNPFLDNGIKFFGRDGFKLLDEEEEQIERLIEEGAEQVVRPFGADVGRYLDFGDAASEYARFLAGTVRHRLDGLKLVLDCANGAASAIAPGLFRSLGADVVVLHNEPDGLNINVQCGSTHPESLQQAVVAEGADAGLAFDGDADRLIAVDSRGGLLDGDYILAICGTELAKRGCLGNNGVVATVMSNVGLDKALREHGIRLHRVAVGDRYVMEGMREHGCLLGGEQSGHVIFLQHTTTGDGLLTALQLLDIMRETGKPLHVLRRVMTSYPQVLVNVAVASKEGFADNPQIREAIRQAERKLGNDGRVLVRPSGTEPLIRVMAEGTDPEMLQELVDRIAAVIQQQLG